jgi:hypothetical protein
MASNQLEELGFLTPPARERLRKTQQPLKIAGLLGMEAAGIEAVSAGNRPALKNGAPLDFPLKIGPS